MTDGDDAEVVVKRLSPEASFELLAHEIRVRILETLDEGGPLSHTDIRRRIDVRDPGKFNYHLQKLDGQFVRRVEDGYELTPAGRRVVSAVLSGGYTSDLVGDTIPTDADCLRCGGPLVTHIEGGGVHVACNACGQRFNSVDIPPGVLEGRDRTALYELVDRWVKRRLAGVHLGFCHRCDGPVDQALVHVDDEDAWAGRDTDWLAELPLDVLFRERCTRCDRERHALVGAAILLHPAVAGFHHDHGIDVRTTPMTDLDWLEMGVVDVDSTDPLVATVPIDLDGERLTVSLDAEFSVINEHRS